MPNLTPPSSDDEWSWSRASRTTAKFFCGGTLVLSLTLASVRYTVGPTLFQRVGKEQSSLWKVGGAMLVLNALSTVFAVMLGRRAARRFLRSHSHSVSLKEAVRSTVSSVALISALVLTVTAAVVLMTKPDGVKAWFDESELKANGMSSENRERLWLHAFALASLAWSLLATVICILNLIFTDGLSDDALLNMIHENEDTFGSPLLMTTASLCFLYLATLVFVHIEYGITCWLFTVMLGYGCFFTIFFVYYKLSRWENVLDARKDQELGSWDVSRVEDFLQQEGFEEQSRIFAQSQIDGQVLYSMTEGMLLDLMKELRVKPYRTRYKLASKLMDLVAGKRPKQD